MSFREGFKFVCFGTFTANGNVAVVVNPTKPISANSIILFTASDGAPMAEDVPQPRVIDRDAALNRFRIQCSGANANIYTYLVFEPTA